MSQISDRGNRDQGSYGASSTKGNGSHTEVASDVKLRGKNGSHLDATNVDGGARNPKGNGSHLDPGPNVPGSDKTAVRGGGGKVGHDRANPTAGKAKSGSKNAQHPNVNARNGGASGSYLGR